MANRPYVVSDRCTRSCSIHPDNLDFSNDVLLWYNDRHTIEWMINASEKKGRKLSQAALSRHRKHLDYEDEDFSADAEQGDSTVDHLKVLQRMIAQGAKRSSSWRIGPAETLKAMDMYYRLTQGSAMRDLFGALTAAAANDSATEEEFDAGSLSPAETESLDADSP